VRSRVDSDIAVRPRAAVCWRRGIPLLPWQMTLAAALALTSGCAPKAQHGPAQSPEHAGCREQLADGTCLLEASRKLVVVTPGAQAVHWATDVGIVKAEQRSELVDGVRETLVLPEGASVLEGSLSETSVVRYRLPLSHEPQLPLLEQALALRSQGKLAEATRLLEQAKGLSARDETRRTFTLGRFALGQGDLDRARLLLWQAAEQAAAQGLASLAVDAANMLGYAEAQLAHAPDRADRALAFARKHAAGFGEGLAVAAYNEAFAAAERGDLRTSLAKLGEAEQAAERLAMADLMLGASDARATTLARLGRYEEASTVHQKLLEHAPEGDLCLRARLLGNAGWTMLSAYADAAPEKAEPLRTQASELFEREAQAAERCDNTSWRADARVNLALLALTLGDTTRAKRELALSAQASENDAFTALWKLEAEGKLALLEQRAKDAEQPRTTKRPRSASHRPRRCSTAWPGRCRWAWVAACFSTLAMPAPRGSCTRCSSWGASARPTRPFAVRWHATRRWWRQPISPAA
jgi:tetratricopeptide (TPR) repeat protein